MGKIYDHLQLIGPRVLVRPLPDLGVTQSGLVLPDTGLHQQNRAIVEKVGPGEMSTLRTPCAVCGGEGQTRQNSLELFETCTTCDGVGDRPARQPMTLAVGDLVLYQKFAGTWVILDEHKRLMLLEDEVQGLVPAAAFTLIRHDDENEHLEGEPCLTCLEPIQQARNAEARAELDRQRAELVASSRSAS